MRFFQGYPTILSGYLLLKEVQMKRVMQLLVVGLIIACFSGNALAEDQANPFHGFWKTERGSIIKIEGDQGVFVYTPVKSWKEYIDEVVVRNIREQDGNWVADEYIAPDGKPFWEEIEWKLEGDRIVRKVFYQGEQVESFYVRVDAVPAEEGSSEKMRTSSVFEGNAGKVGIGGRALYINYAGDNYGVYDPDMMQDFRIDWDPDDAAMFGGTLTWFAHEYFSFELACDYVETDLDVRLAGVSAVTGELTQIPVTLALRTHFSTNPRVSPYLGGGAGWYFNDFDPDSDFWGTGLDVEVEDTYGLFVCGGIELFVTDCFAIDINAKYVWTEITLEPEGYVEEDFDGDAFIGGIGFKLYFN
jgi:outer membrane protein W